MMRKINKMLLKALRGNGRRKETRATRSEVINTGFQYIKHKCDFLVGRNKIFRVQIGIKSRMF